METTKICSKCKTEKLTTQFYKKKDTKDGLTLKCKTCIKEYNTENKNKINARRREKHKENPNKMKIQNKINYERNKEKRLAKNKEYHELHKEKLKEYRKKYYCSERGKISLKNSRYKRRAIIKNGDVTNKQLLELINKSKKCYWCDCKIDKNNYHIDHITPLSKGGLHTLYNLVVSCPSCNLQKGSKDPFKFAIEKGKLF